jgi:hypothetical protein
VYGRQGHSDTFFLTRRTKAMRLCSRQSYPGHSVSFSLFQQQNERRDGVGCHWRLAVLLKSRTLASSQECYKGRLVELSLHLWPFLLDKVPQRNLLASTYLHSEIDVTWMHLVL